MNDLQTRLPATLTFDTATLFSIMNELSPAEFKVWVACQIAFAGGADLQARGFRTNIAKMASMNNHHFGQHIKAILVKETDMDSPVQAKEGPTEPLPQQGLVPPPNQSCPNGSPTEPLPQQGLVPPANQSCPNGSPTEPLPPQTQSGTRTRTCDSSRIDPIDRIYQSIGEVQSRWSLYFSPTGPGPEKESARGAARVTSEDDTAFGKLTAFAKVYGYLPPSKSLNCLGVLFTLANDRFGEEGPQVICEIVAYLALPKQKKTASSLEDYLSYITKTLKDWSQNPVSREKVQNMLHSYRSQEAKRKVAAQKPLVQAEKPIEGTVETVYGHFRGNRLQTNRRA